MALPLAGCATASIPIPGSYHLRGRPFDPPRHARVTVEPCRSVAPGIDSEVTMNAAEALRERLAGSGVFEVVDGADVVASCDIEMFRVGRVSAEPYTRQGTNGAQVAVTLWNASDGKALVVARGRVAGAARPAPGLSPVGIVAAGAVALTAELVAQRAVSDAIGGAVYELVEWSRSTGAARVAVGYEAPVAWASRADPTRRDTGPFTEVRRLDGLEPGRSGRRDVHRALGTPDGLGDARLPGDPALLEVWHYDDFDVSRIPWTPQRARHRVRQQRLLVLFRDGVLDGYFWWADEGRSYLE